jgi:hypothetical protein
MSLSTAWAVEAFARFGVTVSGSAAGIAASSARRRVRRGAQHGKAPERSTGRSRKPRVAVLSYLVSCPNVICVNRLNGATVRSCFGWFLRVSARLGPNLGPGPILAFPARSLGARVVFRGSVIVNWQSGDILIRRLQPKVAELSCGKPAVLFFRFRTVRCKAAAYTGTSLRQKDWGAA